MMMISMYMYVCIFVIYIYIYIYTCQGKTKRRPLEAGAEDCKWGCRHSRLKLEMVRFVCYIALLAVSIVAYIHIFICMYIYIYIYICIYAYIHTYTHRVHFKFNWVCLFGFVSNWAQI